MDNIRAAVNHAVQTNNFDVLVGVIRGLGSHYAAQSAHQECVRFFDQLLTPLSQDTSTPPRLLFWLIIWQITMLNSIGKETKAWKMWPKSQALLQGLAQEEDDVRAEQAFANYVEGYYLHNRQPEKSRELFQQSCDLEIELENHAAAGFVLIGYARAARNQGDHEAAEAATAEAIALFEAVNDRRLIAMGQRLMGTLLGVAGRYEEAELILTEAIRETRQMNLNWDLANGGLSKLRMVYFFSGQFEDALVPNAEYQALSEDHGYDWGVVVSKVVQGQLYLHLGRYAEAREQGESATSQTQNETHLCEALILLVQAEVALGNIETAREHLKKVTRLLPARLVGTDLFVVGNQFYMGLLAAIDRQLDDAWDNLGTELESAIERKDILALANSIALGAFLKSIQGDASSALELYALAQQSPFVANSKWFDDIMGRGIDLAAQSLEPERVREARLRGETISIFEGAAELVSEIRVIASQEK
jgi:tetratricopeptide (TPR) repeat protein